MNKEMEIKKMAWEIYLSMMKQPHVSNRPIDLDELNKQRIKKSHEMAYDFMRFSFDQKKRRYVRIRSMLKSIFKPIF